MTKHMTHYINYMIVQYIFPKMTVMKKWAIKIIKKSRNYELIGNMPTYIDAGNINSIEKYYAFIKYFNNSKKIERYDMDRFNTIIRYFRISDIINNIKMSPVSKQLPYHKLIKTLRKNLELVKYKDYDSSNHNAFFSENNNIWAVKYLLKNPQLINEHEFSKNTNKKAIKYLQNNPKHQDWFDIATTHSDKWAKKIIMDNHENPLSLINALSYNNSDWAFDRIMEAKELIDSEKKISWDKYVNKWENYYPQCSSKKALKYIRENSDNISLIDFYKNKSIMKPDNNLSKKYYKLLEEKLYIFNNCEISSYEYIVYDNVMTLDGYNCCILL